MSSWVCHAAGLPVEELNRQLIYFLGRTCRPPHWAEYSTTPPSSGFSVQDSQGVHWDCGDGRAKQIDSIGRLIAKGDVEHAGGSGGVADMVTPKLRLDSMRVASGPAHALLLPDLAEVQGDLGPPMCVYAGDGPPGMNLSPSAPARPGSTVPGTAAAIGAPGAVPSSPASRSASSQALRPPSPPGPPRLTLIPGSADRRTPGGSPGAKSAPVASSASRVYNPRVSSAHDIMNKRRVKTKVPEYFCLAVPCCRLFIGRSTDLEEPGADASDWPRFISAVVIGGRLDGCIVPKLASQNVGSTALGPDGRQVTWRSSGGDRLVLDFHGVPAQGPKGMTSKSHTLSELLTYLDESWVSKVRAFPVAWSLLWVETLDTEVVLRELRCDVAPGTGRCPACRATLLCVSRNDHRAPRSAGNLTEASTAAAAQSRLTPTPTPGGHTKSPAADGAGGGGSFEAKNEAKIVAFETGQLPCTRCGVIFRRTSHVLVCPNYGRRCFHFQAVCMECRVIIEHIVQVLHKPPPMEQIEAEEDADEEDDENDIGDKGVKADESLARQASQESQSDEVCLAAEIEIRLNISGVPTQRQGVYVEQLVDELRRVLGVPKNQIIILQDNECFQGTIQVGLLHPDLVSARLDDAAADNFLNDEFDTPSWDLTRLWHRLALVVAGDAGKHRLGHSNAFEIMRRASGKSLRWRSAIVAPSGECKRLVDNLRRIQEERTTLGSDSEGSDGNADGGTPKRGSFRDSHGSQLGGAALSLRSTKVGIASAGEMLDGGPSRPPGDDARSRNSVWETWVGAGDESSVSIRARGSKLRRALLGIDAPLSELSDHSAEEVQQTAHSATYEAQTLWHGSEDVLTRPPWSEVEAAKNLRLHMLAWSNDFEGLQACIGQSTVAQLNEADRCGRRPLHVAIVAGSAAVVALLARLAEEPGPVRIDARDAKGRTPLHYCAFRGDVSIAACLVKVASFGKLNVAEPENGETPVLIAARIGNSELLRTLIEGLASVHTANFRGILPLHYAAASGNADCCRLLLRHNASPKARDNISRTPRRWALQHRNFEAAALFEAGCDEEDEFRGMTAEMTAAKAIPAVALDLPGIAPPRSASLASAAAPAPAAAAPPPPSSPRRRPGRRPGGEASFMRAKGQAKAKIALQSVSVEVDEGPPTPDGEKRAAHELPALGGSWPGNVSSLHVRWRGWAEAHVLEPGRTFRRGLGADHEGGGAAGGSGCVCARPGSGQQPRRHRSSPAVALLRPAVADRAMSAEAPNKYVAEVSEKLGGCFCTQCWEYVLDGHFKP